MRYWDQGEVMKITNRFYIRNWRYFFKKNWYAIRKGYMWSYAYIIDFGAFTFVIKHQKF